MSRHNRDAMLWTWVWARSWRALNAFLILTDREETKNIKSRLIATSNQLRGDEGLIYGNEKEAEAKKVWR